MTIFERVRLRVDEDIASNGEVQNNIDTVTARLCLRLGVNELPAIFETICADATVKMIRRTYYEGISSEGAEGITTSFVEDILDEYKEEIDRYRNADIAPDGELDGRRIHFL